jgi:hypothetical protein
MRKLTAILLATVMLVTLAESLAYCASGDIWLAGYLLLTLRTPTEAKALQTRVDAVQARANDLLALSNTLPKIEVRKCRCDTSIYAGGKVFLTITAADAKAGKTTVAKLAKSWADKLRTTLPKATPIQH